MPCFLVILSLLTAFVLRGGWCNDELPGRADMQKIADILDAINGSVGGPKVADALYKSGKVILEIPRHGETARRLNTAIRELIAPGISAYTVVHYSVVQVSGRGLAIVAISRSGTILAAAAIKPAAVLALGVLLGIGLANLDAALGGYALKNPGECLGDLAHHYIGPAPKWMYPLGEFIDKHLLVVK